MVPGRASAVLLSLLLLGTLVVPAPSAAEAATAPAANAARTVVEVLFSYTEIRTKECRFEVWLRVADAGSVNASALAKDGLDRIGAGTCPSRYSPDAIRDCIPSASGSTGCGPCEAWANALSRTCLTYHGRAFRLLPDPSPWGFLRALLGLPRPETVEIADAAWERPALALAHGAVAERHGALLEGWTQREAGIDAVELHFRLTLDATSADGCADFSGRAHAAPTGRPPQTLPLTVGAIDFARLLLCPALAGQNAVPASSVALAPRPPEAEASKLALVDAGAALFPLVTEAANAARATSAPAAPATPDVAGDAPNPPAAPETPRPETPDWPPPPDARSAEPKADAQGRLAQDGARADATGARVGEARATTRAEAAGARQELETSPTPSVTLLLRPPHEADSDGLAPTAIAPGATGAPARATLTAPAERHAAAAPAARLLEESDRATTPLDLERSDPASGEFTTSRAPRAAGSGLAAIAGLVLATLALGVAALALGARLDAKRLLAHPLRARLLDRIRAKPGIPLSELAAAEGIHSTTARYHLRLLERHGHVIHREAGSIFVYYLNGQAASADPARAAALARPTAQAVALAIEANPGASISAIARAVGLDVRHARYHVRNLERAGIVETRDVDGERACRAIPREHATPA